MKYVSEVNGCNSRLDPIQAAVLQVKVPGVDECMSQLATSRMQVFSI